jgi:autotransporter-associated beta strand protein
MKKSIQALGTHPYPSFAQAPWVTLAMICCFGIPQAQAAGITWGTATTISADTDIFNVGLTKYAYDVSNTTISNFNGVNFSAGNSDTSLGSGAVTIIWSGTSDKRNGLFATGGSGLSAKYNDLIKGAAYAVSVGSGTVNLNNLTVNHVYAAQFWVNDSRSLAAGRSLTLSSSGGNSVVLDHNNTDALNGVGQYSIGGFTAGGTSQSFSINAANGAQMNAIQVRDVTGVWSGAASGTWDDASANFTGGSDWTSASGLIGGSGTVYFADTDGFKNAVGNNVVSIQSAGVSTGTINFQNNSVNYTINNVSGTTGITGSTAISKTGTGTVTLAGANTYTGNTTISEGTLALSGGNNVLADTNAVNIDNAAGIFNISAITTSETIGSLAGVASSSVVLGGKNLTVGDANNTAYAGVISGTLGSLTKQGAGTLTLSGVNTYTGDTLVNAGSLTLANGGGLKFVIGASEVNNKITGDATPAATDGY